MALRRILLAALLLLAGCAAPDPVDLPGLRVMVPNPPGSGYDFTARAMARALGDSGVLPDVEVFNLPGGSGTTGLHRLVYESGNGTLMMLMGLGLVGAEYTSGSALGLSRTTPIARLVSEPGIIVVRGDSAYADMGDLVDAWRRDPATVPVGGGSSPGGPDHLAPMLVAEKIGIAPGDVQYHRYDGGGDLLAAILSGEVAFGVSGVGEYADQIRSGQLRILASTGEKTSAGAPTLRECGIDVVFENWRGIVAPPGLAPEQTALLTETVRRLHESPQWAAALERYGWRDAYLEGPAFGEYIAAESARMADTLGRMGLGR
ncbi:Bug family tripartite tricarboxylate transporter substrate binding protein [Actinorhabdospora filicis]|nr:tripartite tricarboxylate transporter substrate-binding protein [Actinorhabdospora filicis]